MKFQVKIAYKDPRGYLRTEWEIFEADSAERALELAKVFFESEYEFTECLYSRPIHITKQYSFKSLREGGSK